MAQKQQQQLILDVPFKNICAWMQERRLLPQDWVTKLKAAQIKSEELRSTGFPVNHPEQAVRDLYKRKIQGKGAEDFLYQDAREVFLGLTEGTEEGRQKNIIGRYKSQLVVDWQLLLRIYEKDNLYLAEYGKTVQQLQGFDLPSLKKQFQQMTKQVNDSTQRQTDLKRNIKEQDRKFNEECQKLGIVPTVDAEALERQAIKIIDQLPVKFRQIETLARSTPTLRLAVAFYREFTKDPKALLHLDYLVRFGDENLALYQSRQKNGYSAGISEELKDREEHKYDLYSRFDQIVFNDTAIEIDVSGNANGGVIEIDWSQIDVNNFTLEESSSAPADQNWNVVQDAKEQPFEIVKVETKSDPNKYNEEETILYHVETRLKLINDIEELDGFLRQRQSELQSKDQTTYNIYSSQGQQLSSELKDCDTLGFSKLSLQALQDITAILNHKDTQYLIILRTKPKQTAQRVVQKLLTYPRLVDKSRDQITALEKKDRELTKEIQEAKKQIEQGEKRVRELSQIVQTELTQKIKGATVKIIL